MEAKDRIILAADFNSLASLAKTVMDLQGHIGMVKFGLEVMNAEGAPQTARFIKQLGIGMFCDEKLFDIPNTVANASAEITSMGVDMFNIHCLAGVDAMRAGKEASMKKAEELGIESPLVAGVTILTSQDFETLESLGFALDPTKDKAEQVASLVIRLASLAIKADLDAIICSPLEAGAIKDELPDLITVCPGIRREGSDVNDQKRVSTPRGAAKVADYMVIGRDITKATNKAAAAVAVASDIDAGMRD